MTVPWGALASVGMGVLGASGQVQTNRLNRQMAREQMRFQERMSSTAAQRAAMDFQAAGLNPALAYGQTASSPSGSSSVMGDPAAAGIASAQQAREVAAQLRLVGQQTEKVAAERKSAEVDARIKANTEDEAVKTRLRTLQLERENMERDAKYQAARQPVDLRLQALDELLRRYSLRNLPAQALSRLFPLLGSAPMFERGHGPSMDFESALPSRTPDPSPFAMRRQRP